MIKLNNLKNPERFGGIPNKETFMCPAKFPNTVFLKMDCKGMDSYSYSAIVIISNDYRVLVGNMYKSHAFDSYDCTVVDLVATLK
jgi:hypothetical protein